MSEDNKILSMGYNGFPRGCSDDEFPWGKTSENPLENKYLYTTHSELKRHPELPRWKLEEPSCM